MKKETVEKSVAILNEIKELSKIDKLLSGKHSDVVNFIIRQHFGDTKQYDRVQIDKRHTPRLIEVVREIISELETELEEI